MFAASFLSVAIGLGSAASSPWTAEIAARFGQSGPAGRTDPPPAQVQEAWWDRTAPGRDGLARSRFYRIRTDIPAEEARALAKHLDTMYLEYQKRLGQLQQRSPEALDVLIFRRQQEYLDTLRSRFGIEAKGSGGMFFTSANGAALAFWTEGLPRSRIEHVIQHEAFHQYAHSRFGNNLPIWANEGLAEFFGESVVIDGTVVVGQTSERTIRALQKAIAEGKHIPFRDLITMSMDRWNANVQGGAAALQYMQAWSVVHFLVYGDDGRYRAPFEQYLLLLNRGAPPAEAFVRAFATDDLDAFEARWKAHAASARPSAFVTAFERIQFLADGIRTLAETGIRPKDMEGLRQALKEATFRSAISGMGGAHGGDVTLSAEDDLLFQVPDDDLSKGTPQFELVEGRARRPANKRERELAERSPMPIGIETRGLAPRNLVVRWIRDGEAWRWEIDVK